jgi:hypothetical protein
LDQLGLQQFKPDADGTEFFPLKKLCVAIDWNVRGGFLGVLVESGSDGRIIGVIIEGFERSGNSGRDGAP